MKSIRYRNTIIISVISLAFICAVVVFAYNLTKSKSKVFVSDGYVLNTLGDEGDSGGDKEKSEVQHFDENTKYNKRWDGTIDFKNEKGEPIKASSKGFLYYNNNNLETIDKAVLLDTNDIDKGGKVASYSMPEGTIIKKAGDGYELTNLEDTIKLEDYIWKVDETKYLVVSDQIEVMARGEKKENLDRFVELTYVEGGIVRLTNDKYNYQTIMSDTKIKLKNNSEIDLNSKDIEVAGKSVTNLSKMLVNSSDNVEIVENNRDALIKNETVADKEKSETQAQAQAQAAEQAAAAGQQGAGSTTNNTNNANNSSNTSGGSTSGGVIGGGAGGGGGGSQSNPSQGNDVATPLPSTEDTTEDNNVTVKFNAPQFKITQWEVDATEFAVEMEKTDKDNVLSGDAKIIVFEKVGDAKLPEDTWPLADLTKEYRTTRVRPGVDYILQVQGEYKVGEESFSKVFLEKEFRTDTLGVGFNVKSAQTEAIIVNVTKDRGTAVKSATMALYDDAGEEVAKLPVEFGEMEGSSAEIRFDSLTDNTRYKLMMESLQAGRETIDKLDDGIEVSTLRKGPTIGNPIVKVDKAKQTFELSVDNIADPTGGVKGVVYRIYDVGDTETPVLEQKRDAASSAVVSVDGNTIQQGSVYTFKAVVQYYDNEKVVEYSTVMSPGFSMSGVKLPEVIAFEAGADGYTRFDSIKGYIRVKNAERTIDEVVQAEYTLSGDTSGLGDVHKGQSTVYREGDDILIPVEKNGLRAGQSYAVTATVSADLLDGNGVKPLPLQSVTIATVWPNKLGVTFTPNEFDKDNKMNFTVQLAQGTAPTDAAIPPDYEATTMRELVFKLYRGSGGAKEYKGNVVVTGKNIEPYDSSLKVDFYDKAYKVNDDFFRLVSDDLSGREYTIELDKIYDYTDAKNEIEVIGSREVIIFPNAGKPSNEDLQKVLKWSQKTKAQAGDTTAELDNDTIVAGAIDYKFPAELPVSALITRIYVEKADGVQEEVGKIERRKTGTAPVDTSIKFKISRGTNRTIEDDIGFLENGLVAPDASGDYTLLRGLKYHFDYDAEFDLDFNGVADYLVTTVGKPGYEEVNDWVKPSAQINKQNGKLVGHIRGSSYSKPATGDPTRGHRITYHISRNDYDAALQGNKVVLNQGNTNIDRNLTSDAAEYTIGNLFRGMWRVSGKAILNKSVKIAAGDNATEKTINLGSFYLDQFTDIDRATGDSYIQGNRTRKYDYTLRNTAEDGTVNNFLTLDIADAKREGAKNRIAKVEVRFKDKDPAGHQGRTWVTVPTTQNATQIPYASIPKVDLDQLKGKAILLDVRVTYDTGEFQANDATTTSVLMQEPHNGNGAGQYYSKTEETTPGAVSFYGLSGNAANSIQSNVQFDGTTFKAQKQGQTTFSQPFNFSLRDSVIRAQKMTGQNSETSVWFKKISTKQIDRKTADTVDVVLPDFIPPLVSVRDAVLSLDSIRFNVVINQSNSDRANDYTVELFKRENDVNGNPTLDKVGQQVIPGTTQGMPQRAVSFGGENNANILAGKELTISTPYLVKVKGRFTVAGQQKEVYLPDLFSGEIFEVEYITEGNVEITDIKYGVENKKLVIRHELSPASALQKVEYVLEADGKSQTVEKTKAKNELRTNMKVEFSLDPDFPLGKVYTLKIKPYARNAQNQSIELTGVERQIDAVPLEGPKLTLTYSSEASTADPSKVKLKIDFIVSDPQGATDDIAQAMTLQLLDRTGSKIDDTYTTTNATPTVITGKMETDSLNYNTEYTVQISGNMDSNLDGVKDETFSQSYRIKTIAASGISAGDISISAKDNNLVVSFQNSDNLVSADPNKGAKMAKYTLYNEGGQVITTGSEAFTPNSYNNGKLYTYKIKHQLATTAMTYQIRLSLYDANNNLVVDYNGKYTHNYG